jgi:hypothetical protein
MLIKKAVTAGLAAGVIAVPIASIAPVSALAAPAASTRHAAAVAHTVQLPAGPNGHATFTLTRFVNRHGHVYAQGVVRAVNTRTHQTAVRTVSLALQPMQRHMTANATAQTCTILDLTLGPLHLNLLGLVIDLNQVHLVITAQQGPGNLLGNLLCALANLLNPSGTGVALNLNRLLGLTPA